MESTVTFGASGHALAALQLFQGVRAEPAMAILAACPVIRLAAGRQMDAGDHGACLYVLLRGVLDIAQANRADRDGERGIARVLPGECTGELAVLDGEAGSDMLLAREDAELLVIGADTLWRLIDESNGVARNLLRLLSFRIRAANAQLRRREKLGEFYRQMSMADALTGLQNRAWLSDHLPALVDSARQNGQPLSLVMVDIDHFKRFNDEHGHQSGDQALQAAARAILGTLRPSDFAVRYGGEELLVILPGTASTAAALVAERLWRQLRAAVVFDDMRKPLPHITASLGLATLAPGQDADGLVAHADAALYRAKEAGRDRVAL